MNDFKAANHSQQTQAHQQMQNSKSFDDISRNLSNQPNYQRQRQKQQQQHPSSNYSREYIQNPSCFNELSDPPPQQQQHDQQQQKQYPLSDFSRGQQQMHTSNSFNETPRGRDKINSTILIIINSRNSSMNIHQTTPTVDISRCRTQVASMKCLNNNKINSTTVHIINISSNIYSIHRTIITQVASITDHETSCSSKINLTNIIIRSNSNKSSISNTVFI